MLTLRFAENSIKNDKLTDLFPLNPIRTKNITRKHEKYQVKHANTDRLRKSAIIHMQHLLNKKNAENRGINRKKI